MKSTKSRLSLVCAHVGVFVLSPMAASALDQTIDNLTVTNHADVMGTAEVGTFRINTNNDASPHQRHAWRRFSWGGGGAQADTEWKKVARLNPNGSAWAGIAFEGRIFDHRTNIGGYTGVSIPFSGSVRGFIQSNDPNNNTAILTQGLNDQNQYPYVRIVRLQETNDFELQVRTSAWRWMEVEWRITGDYNGAQNIDYYDTGPLTAGSAGIGDPILPTTSAVSSTGTLWAGKVGVNTASPGAALDVVGDIRVSGNIIKTGTGSQGNTTLGGDTLAQQVKIDSATGRVGIGGEHSNSRLYTKTTSTNATTASIGTRSDASLNSGASTADLTSVYAQSSYDSTSTGNHSVGALVGVRAISRNDSAYNVATANGVRGEVWQYGTGSITTANALVAGNPWLPNGGTINMAAGVRIDPQKITGVASGYGIYQVGALDANYFAGNVGVGTSAPRNTLDVVKNHPVIGAAINLRSYTNSGSGTSSAPTIKLLKAHGTEIAPTDIGTISNERVGKISFSGYYASSEQEVASIVVNVDGSPNGSAVPGVLAFQVGSQTAGAPKTVMAVNSVGTNGTVQINGDVKVANRAVIRVSQAGDIPMIANPVGTNPEQ